MDEHDFEDRILIPDEVADVVESPVVETILRMATSEIAEHTEHPTCPIIWYHLSFLVGVVVLYTRRHDEVDGEEMPESVEEAMEWLAEHVMEARLEAARRSLRGLLSRGTLVELGDGTGTEILRRIMEGDYSLFGELDDLDDEREGADRE